MYREEEGIQKAEREIARGLRGLEKQKRESETYTFNIGVMMRMHTS